MQRKEIQKVHVNITIDGDLNEWVEEMAKELRLNKSQFINNLIAAGKDDVRILKFIGAYRVADVLRKLKKKALEAKNERVSVKGRLKGI